MKTLKYQSKCRLFFSSRDVTSLPQWEKLLLLFKLYKEEGQRGVRIALQVKADMTHVNDQPVNDLPNCPFGGEKNSGLGRFGGDWIIEEFTTDHWVSVQHQPRQYPF